MKNHLVNLKKKTVLPRDDDEIRAKYASGDYTQKQLAEEYGLFNLENGELCQM